MTNKDDENQEEVSPDPGVFITKGMQISLPGFSIRINEHGEIESDPVTLHTGIDMCPYWLEIALIHLSKSDEAHASLMEAKASADNEAISTALGKDFISGMQAIMASAIAIDAYYATVKDKISLPDDLVKTWKENGTARYKQIAEVLRRAFKLSNKSSKNLRDFLNELFRFRDLAVHPKAGTTSPTLHPELNKVSDWRFAAFRNHNAHIATKITLSIVNQTINKGAPHNEALDKYCLELSNRIEPIITKWQETYGDL